MFATLVHRGWYDNVYVNRLVVGHTHCAIDQVRFLYCACIDQPCQLFRTARGAIKRRDLIDIVDLVKALNKGFVKPSTRPDIVVVDNVLAWGEWFDDHLEPVVSGIKRPLGFWFHKEAKTGTTGFLYKMWPAMESKWIGEDGKADGQILRILRTHPSGQPAVKASAWNSDLKQSALNTAAKAKRFVSSEQFKWLNDLAETGNIGATSNSASSTSRSNIGTAATCVVGQKSEAVNLLSTFPHDMWVVPNSTSSTLSIVHANPPLRPRAVVTNKSTSVTVKRARFLASKRTEATGNSGLPLFLARTISDRRRTLYVRSGATQHLPDSRSRRKQMLLLQAPPNPADMDVRPETHAHDPDPFCIDLSDSDEDISMETTHNEPGQGPAYRTRGRHNLQAVWSSRCVDGGSAAVLEMKESTPATLTTLSLPGPPERPLIVGE
jgi:hypothetical protein